MNRNEADVLINQIETLVDDPIDSRVQLLTAEGRLAPPWTDKLASQSFSLFIAWRIRHGSPETRPPNEFDALAAYANWPETSDEDYAKVRDHARELAEAMTDDKAKYGVQIPAVLAQLP